MALLFSGLNIRGDGRGASTYNQREAWTWLGRLNYYTDCATGFFLSRSLGTKRNQAKIKLYNRELEFQ